MSQKYVHINCCDPLQKRSDLQRNSDCLFFFENGSNDIFYQKCAEIGSFSNF